MLVANDERGPEVQRSAVDPPLPPPLDPAAVSAGSENSVYLEAGEHTTFATISPPATYMSLLRPSTIKDGDRCHTEEHNEVCVSIKGRWI